MQATLYRRPLPAETIAFSSPEGRRIFAEALAAGGLDGYFLLAEQFHTQADPAFCGLGSLVVALNALGIDPGRLWKGPWRWFAEDLLDCCIPLSEVRERGVTLDELACLARCNGAEVEVRRADVGDVAPLRAALANAASGGSVLIAAYDRALLGQTGSGHFSPLGGYHAQRDLVLILDVARFKYPPHWVASERLWRAMQSIDPAAGRRRGFMALRRRAQPSALGYTVSCEGDSWRTLSERVRSLFFELETSTDLDALACALSPLCAHLEARMASEAHHAEAFAAARAALYALPAYARVLAAVGPERAEAATILLLAVADYLSPARRAELGLPEGSLASDEALAAELGNVRAQLAALAMHAGPG